MSTINSQINSQGKLFATVSLNWRSAEQGGRKRTIAAPDYAATVYFADGDKHLFSVVLHFPTKLQDDIKIPARLDRADMDFLVPSVVVSRLEKGIKFNVTEGSRVVAEGIVLSVNCSVTNVKKQGRFFDGSRALSKRRGGRRSSRRNVNSHQNRIIVIKAKKAHRDTAIEYEEFSI
jgi:hypothetical protein